MVRYSNLTKVQFSFYVFDQTSKIAAYCWYGSDADSAKFEDAILNGKLHIHQAGVGTQAGSLLLEKPLDLKQLNGTKCSLSLTGKGSSDKGSATLFMNKAPENRAHAMHLLFPILADFNFGPAKSDGRIFEVDIVKTSVPKLPDHYRHQ